MNEQLEKMKLQSEEFDALARLSRVYNAMPSVVDDYYPESRHYYENALHEFLLACKRNGRISPDSKTWRQP